MRTVIRSVFGRASVVGISSLLAAALMFLGTVRTAQAAPAADAKDQWHATLKDPPPADQTYTGF